MVLMNIGSVIQNDKHLMDLFREHGVDVDHQKLVKQQAQAYREHIMRKIQIAGGGAKYVYFDSLCLWEGKQRISSSFDQWKPSEQGTKIKIARIIKNNAINTAQGMVSRPRKILMYGKPGTGKTKLALSIMRYLRANKKTTLFVSSTELIHLFWNSYKYKDAQAHKEKVLDAMKEVDVLILDDLGTEGGANSDKPVQNDVQQALEQIATARYDSTNNRVLKSTIITTNNTPEQLNRIYNPKLVSRLIPHNLMFTYDFSGLQDLRE